LELGNKFTRHFEQRRRADPSLREHFAINGERNFVELVTPSLIG
jgi:hypothetical protein